MNVIYKGADISKYNSINWDKVNPEEMNFVIIRAGYGFKTQDPTFKTNIENAIRLGLHIGIYWFSYASTPEQAKQEAQGCLNIINPYKANIDFPVFFDWEYQSHDYVVKTYKVTPTKQLVSDMAIAFMETIKKSGYKVGNYSNPDYCNRFFNDEVKNNYDTWLAHVGKNGQALTKTNYTGKFVLWQYSWKGRPSGFLTDTDMNYCYKDYVSENSNTSFNTESTTSPVTKKYLVDYQKEQASKVVTYNATTQGNLFLSPHFQVKEFKSPDSNTVKIDNRLIWILERLFTDLNCSKMIINSGHRTSAHDKKVGGSGTGYHTKGMAADIKPYDKSGKVISAKIVCQKLCDYGDVFGIGYINAESVHVDTRSKVNIYWFDETNGIGLIKNGYVDFDDYFNRKTLVVNNGTWNVRNKADISGKVITIIKGGDEYDFTTEKNGWVYIPTLDGWLSKKGFSIKK